MAEWDWKSEAREIQQMYYECFKDRDYDLIIQETILTLKVGYAFFGKPTEEDAFKPYSEDVMKKIKKVICAILRISESWRIYMAPLFVVGMVNSNIISVPVLKILNYGQRKPVFLDEHLRHYFSWEEYLKENTLPKGEFAYPLNGKYQSDKANGRVLITFLPSPKSSIRSKLVLAADISSIAASLVSLTVALAFPPAAPVAFGIATASGLYSVGKGSAAIHDRRIHNQSLFDKDARRLWLQTIGSSVGVLAGSASAAVAILASRGTSIGLAARIAVNVVNGSALAVQGVGLADSVATLIISKENNELTKQDVLNFTMSLLFFLNVSVNIKTAESLIANVQSEIRLVESQEGGLKQLVRFFKRDILMDKTFVHGDTSFAVTNQFLTEMSGMRVMETQHYMAMKKYKDPFLGMSEDLKSKVEVLVDRYFGQTKERYSSKSIEQSKRLAEEKACTTEDGFIDIFRFLLIYKQMRLKEMEEAYERRKRSQKRLLGKGFDESLFDKECGIKDSENKTKCFRDAIEKELEDSNEKLKQKYEESLKEITAVNEDGRIKFFNSSKALNEYFHSFVVDGEEISPREFFRIIRELVGKEDHPCEDLNSGDGKIYSDSTIPVHVKVVEIGGRRFFESVSFVSRDGILPQ